MWIVNGIECANAEKAAQEVIDAMDDSYFVEMLDEIYGTVSICGYEYDASYAYQRLDPTGFRCGMLNYYDGLRSDIESDLEDMEDGDEKMIFKQEVQFISDGWETMKSVASGLGWIVKCYKDDQQQTVMFENCSPLGEDLVYETEYDTIDDVTEYLHDLAMDFDADEHVKELIRASDAGFHGVPQSVSALMEDAKRIGDMLNELSNAIEEAL